MRNHKKSWATVAKAARNFLKHRSLGLWLIFAMVVVVGIFAGWSWNSSRISERAAIEISMRAERSAQLPVHNRSGNVSGLRSTRPVFPYSVIPGGVRSVAELRNAMARDPAVAAHYANFDLSNARVIRVREARLVFVSYRIANRIYWTTKKLKLAKDETVITDGRQTARTRCGNLISATSLEPAFAAEPAIGILDMPQDPGDVPVVADEPVSESAPPSSGNPVLAQDNQPPLDEQYPVPTTPILIFPPSGNPPTAPPPPPVVVPEPATALLLSNGLLAVWWVRNRRKHR